MWFDVLIRRADDTIETVGIHADNVAAALLNANEFAIRDGDELVSIAIAEDQREDIFK